MNSMVPQTNQSTLQLAILRNGASWFYWIAALSAINTIASSLGSTFGSAIGLGVTTIIGIAAEKMGMGGKIICFAFALLFVGLYVLLGKQATNRRNWAFITGLICYGLDTLLLLLLMLMAINDAGS